MGRRKITDFPSVVGVARVGRPSEKLWVSVSRCRYWSDSGAWSAQPRCAASKRESSGINRKYIELLKRIASSALHRLHLILSVPSIRLRYTPQLAERWQFA